MLKRAYLTNILYYLPRSYLYADGKANIKYKVFISLTRIVIDVKYLIPEKYLNKLWFKILEGANNFISKGRVVVDTFSKPFLVISLYNLKLLTKEDIYAAIYKGFCTHFN